MKVLAVILLVASAAVLGHARPAPEEQQQPQRNVTTYGEIFGHAYIGALNILRQWLSTTTEVPTTIMTELPTTTKPAWSFFRTTTPAITDTTSITTTTAASSTTDTETPSTSTTTTDTTTSSTTTTTTTEPPTTSTTTTTEPATTITTTTTTTEPTTTTTTTEPTTTTTTSEPTTTTTTTEPTTTTTTTTTEPTTTTTTTTTEPSTTSTTTTTTTTEPPTTTTTNTNTDTPPPPFILPTTSSDFHLKLLKKLKEEEREAELAQLKTLQLEHDPMERQVSSPKASQTVLEALRNVFKTVWPYLPLSVLLLIIIASVAVRFYQKRKWQADFLHEDLDSVGVKNVEVVI